jgi:hypothetical protein
MRSIAGPIRVAYTPGVDTINFTVADGGRSHLIAR